MEEGETPRVLVDRWGVELELDPDDEPEATALVLVVVLLVVEVGFLEGALAEVVGLVVLEVEA